MHINPQSLSVNQLLSSNNEQYVIPAYQRRYSWQETQLEEIINDLERLDRSDNHFLGSIVCLVEPLTAGMNKLEVVDGQQRLTTISILLQCMGERFKNLGYDREHANIQYLLTAKPSGFPAGPKVSLESLDAMEYQQHVNGPAVLKPKNPNLALAFATFRAWTAKHDAESLDIMLSKLKDLSIVIRLSVSNSKDAFKLFETINNRGLRLSSTDLIKNFLLGNAASFGPSELVFARLKWAEIIKNLDGINQENFFRHFLTATIKKRVTRAYVVAYFKALFEQQVRGAEKLVGTKILPTIQNEYTETEEDEGDEDILEIEDALPKFNKKKLTDAPMVNFQEFVNDLVRQSLIYAEIVSGSTKNHSIDRRLRNLRMIKSVQTYGFLLAMRSRGCPDKTFEQLLELTESFLLRRHICKRRSNENESMFGTLCSVNALNPIPEVKKAFKNLSPTNDDFSVAFMKFEFKSGLIDRARYCLEKFEVSLHGAFSEIEIADTDKVHVEHIIPQTIKNTLNKNDPDGWIKYLGDRAEANHKHNVSKIGNLSLLAGTLNITASNAAYHVKKSEYQKSAIKITTMLPAEYPEFRFEEVEMRSKYFAEMAPKLWPLP
jgi:uncharacterized protein with ParB-like and HNH nuclease domain